MIAAILTIDNKIDNKLLWDDFKIWKLIKRYCKISYIYIYIYIYIFEGSITHHIQVLFLLKFV